MVHVYDESHNKIFISGNEKHYYTKEEYDNEFAVGKTITHAGTVFCILNRSEMKPGHPLEVVVRKIVKDG